jgi:gamma-glutamylaminecyclotransferase
MKLAVYGTLRSVDGINSSYGGTLSEQENLGLSKLPLEYALFNLGSFPCIAVDEGNSVPTVCEVYNIDQQALENCDRIEGHPGFYTRTTVDIEGHGECFTYVLQQHRGIRIISGDWHDK